MNKNLILEDIYKEYMQDVFRYLLSLSRQKEVAEDLLQDTFFKAYQSLESFKGENSKPWLFKIAYYTYIDWYRKSKWERLADKDELANYESLSVASAEESFLRKERINAWLSLTEELNWNQRHSIVLREIFGFSYEEIAEHLNLSLAAVKIAIYRGRKYLEKRMEAEKYDL